MKLDKLVIANVGFIAAVLLVFQYHPSKLKQSVPPLELNLIQILSTEAGQTVVEKQCSRAVPEHGESFRKAKLEEISRLVEALELKIQRDQLSKDTKKLWNASFIAYERKGKHYIYGSFSVAFGKIDETNASHNVCDGGSDYFGVEFEIESSTITHMSSNGFI